RRGARGIHVSRGRGGALVVTYEIRERRPSVLRRSVAAPHTPAAPCTPSRCHSAMTAPAASATKSPSVLEDIVDVFYQPAAVFERRRTAGFGLAWLIYAIMTAAMIYAAQPVMRPMMAIKRD